MASCAPAARCVPFADTAKAMLACTSEYVLYWMVRSVTMNFLSVLLSCCASDNAGPNSADMATWNLLLEAHCQASSISTARTLHPPKQQPKRDRPRLRT